MTKLWPLELHPSESVWIPTFAERQQFLDDRELFDCPITDIGEGDIVLDVKFSLVILNDVSRKHDMSDVLGYALTTIAEDGKKLQGWFYPNETILKVNIDGSTLVHLSPIAQLIGQHNLAPHLGVC